MGSAESWGFNTEAPSALILIPRENISKTKIRCVAVLPVHLCHSCDKKKSENFPNIATGDSLC